MSLQNLKNIEHSSDNCLTCGEMFDYLGKAYMPYSDPKNKPTKYHPQFSDVSYKWPTKHRLNGVPVCIFCANVIYDYIESMRGDNE